MPLLLRLFQIVLQIILLGTTIRLVVNHRGLALRRLLEEVVTVSHCARLLPIVQAEVAGSLAELRVSPHAILRTIVVSSRELVQLALARWNGVERNDFWRRLLLVFQLVGAADGAAADVEIGHLPVHAFAIGEVLASGSVVKRAVTGHV